MFASCSKTPEDKANVLIKEEMSKTLYNPDTYEAIETKIDSAFAPIDDPNFFALVADLGSENLLISQCQDEMNELQLLMNTAEKNKSKDAAKYLKDSKNYAGIMQKCIEKQNSIYESINTKLAKIKEALNAKREFIGFKAMHRYTAKNKDGKQLTEEYCYYFDKDMTKVLLSIPVEKYNLLHETFDQLKDELSKVQNDSVK